MWRFSGGTSVNAPILDRQYLCDHSERSFWCQQSVFSHSRLLTTIPLATACTRTPRGLCPKHPFKSMLHCTAPAPVTAVTTEFALHGNNDRVYNTMYRKEKNFAWTLWTNICTAALRQHFTRHCAIAMNGHLCIPNFFSADDLDT